jgi:folate-binding protein YgfZ
MNKLISEILENEKGLFLDEGLSLLRVSGEDKNKFLQGQLTNDIESLSNNEYLLASYCTHQGKVITNLQILRDDSDILILLQADLANIFIEKISKYILMSKVNFEINKHVRILSAIGDEAISIINKYGIEKRKSYKIIKGNKVYINMSSSRVAMCRCIFLEQNDLPQDIRSTKTCLIDLLNNITRFNIENTEKYIPQVLGADELDTINYKKGCYTGQEVIARTHYLGNVKKHMYLVNIYSSKIKEKNIINNDGESVGEVIGKPYEYNNKLLTHCILRDSCNFNELHLGKDKVEVVAMEDKT